MTDGVKIHFVSESGYSFHRNYSNYVQGYNIPCSTEAENRRTDLIWKYKTRIALRNSILFWVVFIPIAIVETALIFVLFFVTLASISAFLGYSFGAFSGIICAMVIIVAGLLTYDKLDSYFETDPYYIKR